MNLTNRSYSLTLAFISPCTSSFATIPALTSDFVGDFASNYADWPVTKILWALSTLSMAYAVATFAFLLLLGKRSPTVAMRYALFWGGLALILIHIFAFGSLNATKWEPWMILLLVIGIPLAVWIVIALLKRRR
jgi:hypothetical protein